MTNEQLRTLQDLEEQYSFSAYKHVRTIAKENWNGNKAI